MRSIFFYKKQNCRTRFCFFVFLLFIFLSSCSSKQGITVPCEAVNSTYAQSVAPLIQTRCALSGCHNGDSTSVGNYINYNEIKERVDNGLFKLKVIDNKQMPPASKPALTSEEYTKLKCWYEAGAPNN